MRSFAMCCSSFSFLSRASERLSGSSSILSVSLSIKAGMELLDKNRSDLEALIKGILREFTAEAEGVLRLQYEEDPEWDWKVGSDLSGYGGK